LSELRKEAFVLRVTEGQVLDALVEELPVRVNHRVGRFVWVPEDFGRSPRYIVACNRDVAGFRFPQSSRARVVEISCLFLSHRWCQGEQDAGVPLLRMLPADISMSIN
jgi:hypothetical protein